MASGSARPDSSLNSVSMLIQPLLLWYILSKLTPRSVILSPLSLPQKSHLPSLPRSSFCRTFFGEGSTALLSFSWKFWSVDFIQTVDYRCPSQFTSGTSFLCSKNISSLHFSQKRHVMFFSPLRRPRVKQRETRGET